MALAERGRLFRQDRRIAANTIRATFAGWFDRGVAAVLLLLALAIAHGWFADRPAVVAAWTALAGGILAGIGAGRAVAARLAFHAFDGLLAADALDPAGRRRYALAWHGVGLFLLSVVLLIVHPPSLRLAIPAYLAGALLGGWTSSVTLPMRISGIARPGWTIRAWSHRPVAGLAAGLFLMLSLWPARSFATTALFALVGIETLLLAMALSMVDDAVVRFMTIAGHRSRRIVLRHARGVIAFVAVALPGCWSIVGSGAAAIVAVAGVAALSLLALRILAYRLHPRRFADFLVSVMTGVLLLVAYALPVALPVVAGIILWQLRRRGRAASWLLA